MKKIVIVGAGWYGLYIAQRLSGSANTMITIIDKEKTIFAGASTYNQCRLHLGFHYPRSHETRRLCKSGFEMFMSEFGHLTYAIPDNWYVIAQESVLDFETYRGIFEHEQYAFETRAVDAKILCNVDSSTVISVAERGIDPVKAAAHFSELLMHKRSNVTFLFQHEVTAIDCVLNVVNVMSTGCSTTTAIPFDYCYDCTNFRVPNVIGGIGVTPDVLYEQTITLLYTVGRHPMSSGLYNSTKPFGALTVMDGPFFSIFPYNNDSSIYSLTHVKHSAKGHFTPSLKIDIEADVVRYFPTFHEHFTYVGWFGSPKTKPISNSDSRRLLQLRVAPNVERISCGKITGIFLLDL